MQKNLQTVDTTVESLKTVAPAPVELTTEQLLQVGGGGPNGTWAVTTAGPNGTW